MSRSNKSRKRKNLAKRENHWYDYSGWILESASAQRVRLKREVDKVLKDPEYEVQLTTKGPKGAYDWP